MYVGLLQAEPIKRFVAMYSISTALPMINDTLFDSKTREVYIHF
jgi:hypothetical protein